MPNAPHAAEGRDDAVDDPLASQHRRQQAETGRGYRSPPAPGYAGYLTPSAVPLTWRSPG